MPVSNEKKFRVIVFLSILISSAITQVSKDSFFAQRISSNTSYRSVALFLFLFLTIFCGCNIARIILNKFMNNPNRKIH